MKTLIQQFVREECGEDLIEYGLLAGFIGTIATTILIGDPLSLQQAVLNAYERAEQALRDA